MFPLLFVLPGKTCAGSQRQVLVLTGIAVVLIAVVLIALVSSVLSIRRVLVLEPGVVFQG